MVQSIQEQICIVPAIETKLHLLQISREMLGANPMPCSHDSTFQERKGGLHCVCVNVPANVNLVPVPNRLMAISFASHSERISWVLIGHDYIDIFAHILRNDFVDCVCLDILGVNKANIPAALPD